MPERREAAVAPVPVVLICRESVVGCEGGGGGWAAPVEGCGVDAEDEFPCAPPTLPLLLPESRPKGSDCDDVSVAPPSTQKLLPGRYCGNRGKSKEGVN